MVPAGHQVGKKVPSQTESVPIYDTDVKFKVSTDGKLRVPDKQEIHQRYVVIGFFPGMCANWCVGESMKSSYQEDAYELLPISLFNAIICGLPTVLSWTKEFDADWSPPKDKAGRNLTASSVFGWAKTTSPTGFMEYVDTAFQDAPVVSRDKVCAEIFLPEIGLVETVYPDKYGWYRLKLATFKQLVARPWAVQISIPDGKSEGKRFFTVVYREVSK